MVGDEMEAPWTTMATARGSRLRIRRGTTTVPITLHPAATIRSAPTTAARSRPTTMPQPLTDGPGPFVTPTRRFSCVEAGRRRHRLEALAERDHDRSVGRSAGAAGD